MPNPVKIALVDDHVLLRDALAKLIEEFDDCEVTLVASDGRDLIKRINPEQLPDIVLLDLNMPHMDGYETAKWIQEAFPDLRMLMLTMYDSETMLIRLLKAGVRGFLKKDVDPRELRYAIQSVIDSGFYYSTRSTGKLINLFRGDFQGDSKLQKSILSEQEILFLNLACTDLTYKEIAQQMSMNPRAIDNLRDNLFVKLEVKSRVGMAMYSIRHGIVTF